VVEARAQSAHLNDPLIIASEQISLVTRAPSARSTLREQDLSISRVVLVRKRKRRVGQPEVNKRWPRACTQIAVSRRNLRPEEMSGAKLSLTSLPSCLSIAIISGSLYRRVCRFGSSSSLSVKGSCDVSWNRTGGGLRVVRGLSLSDETVP